MTKGIVYVLSNPSMDGYIKIGKTTNLIQRLKSLDNTSTPLPFRCTYAVEVDDADHVEKLAHSAFKRNRVRSNREFFEIDEEQAVAALKISGGKEVTPAVDIGEDSEAVEALEKATSIRSRFKFSMIGLVPGDELEYLRDPAIRSEVIDDTNIEFEGQKTSLSAATLELIRREGLKWKTVAGPQFWGQGGVSLSEMRRIREQSL